MTEPAGEGPRPKLFIANTKFYPLMARPNKAAGAIAGGRRASPCGHAREAIGGGAIGVGITHLRACVDDDVRSARGADSDGGGEASGRNPVKARVAADWENEGFSQPHGPYILQGLITGNQIQNRNWHWGIRGLPTKPNEFRLGPDRFDRVSVKNPTLVRGFHRLRLTLNRRRRDDSPSA